MSEQNNNSDTAETQKSNRPRREDGTFMSKSEIEKLQQDSKDAFSTLSGNNEALMRNTPFNKDYFKGMTPQEVNKFLLNWHKKKEEEAPEPEKEPNTPILGTPIGSGKKKYYLDQFLTIDPKNRTIDFEAPASIALKLHKNQKEAINEWLDQR